MFLDQNLNDLLPMWVLFVFVREFHPWHALKELRHFMTDNTFVTVFMKLFRYHFHYSTLLMRFNYLQNELLQVDKFLLRDRTVAIYTVFESGCCLIQLLYSNVYLLIRVVIVENHLILLSKLQLDNVLLSRCLVMTAKAKKDHVMRTVTLKHIWEV